MTSSSPIERKAPGVPERLTATARLFAERFLAGLQPRAATTPLADVSSTRPCDLPLALDYFVVAATRRYRATQRKPMRDSARHGMVLVGASALLNCLWLAPLHPAAVDTVLALNGVIALTAGLGYGAVATRAKRVPEGFVFAVLATVDAATLALGILRPELSVVAGGYLLLLPVIVALLIPWATRIHIGWLALHTTLVLGYAALAPVGPLGSSGHHDLVALIIVATSVSFFGHVVALRARVLGFVQIERIRALNRQARRDETRLDRLNRILEQTARTDELTGLKNRLSLKLDLGTTRARIARHRERVGLLVLDLDRFKAINDERGHVAGDGVLRDVSRALMGALRPDDGAYRYGGEEFVVLLRLTRPGEALLAAERIRRTIENLDIPHPGNPPHGRVTVSVGVASMGPDDLAADDSAWVARADAALYRAKAAGRNRSEVEIYSGEAP
jgi:diguanylate cyclase (GGDEF)-like protein